VRSLKLSIAAAALGVALLAPASSALASTTYSPTSCTTRHSGSTDYTSCWDTSGGYTDTTTRHSGDTDYSTSWNSRGGYTDSTTRHTGRYDYGTTYP
jgi:hypothetical protein